MQKESNSEPSWLFDSRASHHFTKDLANLSLAHKYSSNHQIVVANGEGLSITHSGSAQLNNFSSPLLLNNVLYVPEFSQNLISISQLCRTNSVSIEFFPWYFQVKDLCTGTILLQGKNETNVYKVSCVLPHSYHVHHQTSLSTWHNHLGLPASNILHHALWNNNISFSSSPLQCLDCPANKSHRLSFARFTLSSSCPLEIIYSDVWDPAPLPQ